MTFDLTERDWAVEDVHTLRHGYNLADVDRLARFSTHRVWGVTVDYRDRLELAWSAIAMRLYTADARPEPSDLITVGQNAIARHHETELHHHGITQRTFAPAPRYAAYWEPLTQPQASPESMVVDSVALWQIWALLTDGEREAVHAYAVYGTHEGAAEGLGITYKAFTARLSAARRRFFALWHEGETPSRLWRTELRSRWGGGMSPERQAQLLEFQTLRENGLVMAEIAKRMRISIRTVERLARLARAGQGQ